MSKREKCPIPLAEQLRHLSQADALAVQDWFETYHVAPWEGKAGREKLTENDVQVLRFLNQCRIPPVIISDLMNVTVSTIYQIIADRTWKHVAYERPETPQEAERAFGARLDLEKEKGEQVQAKPENGVTGI